MIKESFDFFIPFNNITNKRPFGPTFYRKATCGVDKAGFCRTVAWPKF